MARISRKLVLVGKVLILVPGLGCLLLLPLLASYAPLGMSDVELLTSLALLTAFASAAVGSGGVAVVLGLLGERGAEGMEASPPRLGEGPAGARPSNVVPFPTRVRRRPSSVA